MMEQNRCSWCKILLAESCDTTTVTFRPRENIPFESSQYIDRIIFLRLEKESITFENIFEEEDLWIGDHKAIPVVVIPPGDDNRNFVTKACSVECAKALRASLENDGYVFRWNFE